jgi:phosphonate transport system ATP-binding protein
LTPVLVATGLTKRYGQRLALSGAAVSVAPGEFVAVVGASGAGKTTLFRCLTRLVEPDAGAIFLDGQPFHGLTGSKLAQARRRIGVVFQQFNLVRRLSALENVLAGRLATTPLWRVALRCFESEDVRKAVEALDAVGLADQRHQRADTLSGGQQQRVAIARAIVQESHVLLADEPVASLDPDTAVSTLTLMQRLAKARGIGILCTLHQPALAERFGDHVLIMDGGRLAPAQHAPPASAQTAPPAGQEGVVLPEPSRASDAAGISPSRRPDVHRGTVGEDMGRSKRGDDGIEV